VIKVNVWNGGKVSARLGISADRCGGGKGSGARSSGLTTWALQLVGVWVSDVRGVGDANLIGAGVADVVGGVSSRVKTEVASWAADAAIESNSVGAPFALRPWGSVCRSVWVLGEWLSGESSL
jgi:hypothetical protein